MKRPQAPDFPAFEAELLQVWEQESTFAKSLEQRQGAKRFSFYDGPPFANGQPHFGHSLVAAIKDAIGRYQTMRGYYVERRNGWDTHGLPVEFAIEQELGVSGKRQILELGLDKFNEACRASVFRYKTEWEEFFRRIGRWTDTEHAYATIDRDFTESVWWMLGQVQAKELLYRGYKSLPYCPRCQTPISNFELNEGYRDDVSDPSVYALFPLADDEQTALVAWTTTPWSLPANAALAVHPEAKYVTVKLHKPFGSIHKVIVTKQRLDSLGLEEGSFEVESEELGEKLAGVKYEPLYRQPDAKSADYQVAATEIVNLEDGTGVLHVAPAYGEDDLELGQRLDLSITYSVGPDGHVTADMGKSGVPGVGLFFKEADRPIIEDLTEKGRIWSAETFTHTYPFCYRCGSPLLYYAITSWFVRVSAIRDQLLKTAEGINWTPAHIKAGRFGKWLEGLRDWAISRNRYWGAPIPIWVNENDPDDYIVVGSLDELVELAGLDVAPVDLHRPGIDNVVINREGKTYRRVEEVFDCWFESGSVPVGQYHYPFENREAFEESFPATYIGEGLDQTHLWFSVLHVLSTIAFEKPAYQHVLVNGMVMAADGEKLSKRLQNYPPVEEVFATEGADSLRLYLLGNDQAMGADYMRFDRSAMQDVLRNTLLTLWNVYSFLVTYVEVDGLQKGLAEPKSNNILDRWLLARLSQTTASMTAAADGYQVARAVRELRELVSDLSNWYLRRSRRRLSRSDNQADQQTAAETLRYALLRICQLLAPWAPFLADKLWRELSDDSLPASVHLSDWPEADQFDQQLVGEMAALRQAITLGLAQRAAAGIKVRQPLAGAVIHAPAISTELLSLAEDELNVKQVEHKTSDTVSAELDTKLTPELEAEGMARDTIRLVQNARKETGLTVDDRINLSLIVDGEAQDKLAEALKANRELIESETLAASLEIATGQGSSQVPHRVAGGEIYIELSKA